MKVLQINVVCGTGSTGRIAVDLYKVLVEKGHEGIIAYGRGTAPAGVNSIRVGSSLSIYAHVLKARALDKMGFGSKKATEDLILKIKEYNPDVIHLHNIHGYYLNVKVLFDYLKVAGKPVVWTLHDAWPFTGHCAYFDFIKCDKWKTACFSCPVAKEYPERWLLDSSQSNYTAKKELFTSVKNMTIVTPSNWLGDIVKQSYLSKYEVKVINNGIDLRAFVPTVGNFKEANNLENKFIILGVASHWDKRKGLDYFEELAKVLDDSFKVVVIGVTESQIAALPSNILSISRTNNVTALAEIYSAADVFINPTLEDNFPTTNLEALACGTPVITFKTGGSVESVDENTGLIVDQGDLDGLVSAVKSLAVKNFSAEACLKRSKLYDKEERYSDYVSLYTSLMK